MSVDEPKRAVNKAIDAGKTISDLAAAPRNASALSVHKETKNLELLESFPAV